MKKTLFVCAIVTSMTLVSFVGADQDKGQAPKEGQETEEPTQLEGDEGEEQAISSIIQYFQGLNEGQYIKASKAFAPRVAQWITIKNTNPEYIAKEARQFLSTKQNVHYQMHFSTFVYNKRQNTARMVVSQDWKGYHATLRVYFSFDANGKIYSYKEGDILEYNHTNGDLFSYLQQSKKLRLPLEVHFDRGFRKEMTRERAKFFNESLSSFFYDCGYFDLPNGLVGILKQDADYKKNATYLYVIRKSSGKILSIQVLSENHESYNYYYQTVSTITPKGLITTRVKESGRNSAVYKYVIALDGKIKQL